MNGYGQPMITPEQYAQALTSFDAMQRQQQTRDMINQSGNGYAQIGAALGQALAGKFGKNKGQNMGELEQQILQFQEAKKMEAEQREAQKLAQQQQAKQADQMKALVPQFGEQGAAAIVFGGAKPSDVKQEKTSAMQNASAMGLQPGTPQYNAYIQQSTGNPTTNVNVNSGTKYGKIPEGYMLQETPQGARMVLIGGSPAEREQQQLKTKASSRGFAAAFENDNINNVIDQVIENADYGTTGLGGAVAGMIPGTSARDLQENLKTIEADAAFSSLQDMRDNSPTGGALGQVSERELALLSSARAALGASQSPEQFKQNLQRYKAVRNNAFQSVGKAYESDYGQVAPWTKKEQQEQQPQATKSIGGKQYVQIDGQWYEQ